MDMLMGRTLFNIKDSNLVSGPDALMDIEIVVYCFGNSSSAQSISAMKMLGTISKECVKRKHGLRLIYISTDLAKTVYDQEIKELAKVNWWYIIPFGDPLGPELLYKYGITSLPHVVVVNRDGQLITNSGLKELETKGVNVLVTWFD